MGFALLMGGLWLALRGRAAQPEASLSVLEVLAQSSADPVRRFHAQAGEQTLEIFPKIPPFRRLLIEHHPPPGLRQRRWSAAQAPKGKLMILGHFTRAPVREMAWVEGNTPAKSFPNGDLPGGWIIRELPLIRGRYATRTHQPEPLILAFTEFQARLRPAVKRLLIAQDGAYELTIQIELSQCRPEELPHLLALIWALGRAAQGDEPPNRPLELSYDD